VRAGESPQTLASEADLPVEKILVFAGPVLDERERIIDEARRARASRSDGHLVAFGEAVDGRFAAHGIEPSSVSWTACRRDDGQWLISATWRGGDIDRTAQWSFALAGRMVSPVDDTAADLLTDRPIRPIVHPTSPAKYAEVRPDADTRPLPAVPEPPEPVLTADQEAPPPAEVDQPLPLHVAPEFLEQGDRSATDGVSRVGARRPTPPVPPARPSDETDEQKAARARIPSWDDIMLGVRRKRD
jgi:hypothetical protein